MTGVKPRCNCSHKLLADIESFLNLLPKPLVEPIWYPGVPSEQTKLKELVDKLEEILRELAEMIVRQLEQEGFFEHNPMIRVYPQYPEASGIIIYHKGEKIFERWVSSYELDFGNKRPVARETQAWYEEMYMGHGEMDPEDFGMSPDEYEYYFGCPTGERPI